MIRNRDKRTKDVEKKDMEEGETSHPVFDDPWCGLREFSHEFVGVWVVIVIGWVNILCEFDNGVGVLLSRAESSS